jgi:lipoprotein NlpD
MSSRLYFSKLTLATVFLSLVSACTTSNHEKTIQAPSRSSPSVEALQAKALFVRPSSGPTITRYDSNSTKGIDIAGNAGDPVIAAASGRVVYVGDQLRGYGRMVIIKHNEIYLTAYAHNQNILVSKNDLVAQNLKIAEMGKTDTDRVKLHFELRKNGAAVDPEPYIANTVR